MEEASIVSEAIERVVTRSRPRALAPAIAGRRRPRTACGPSSPFVLPRGYVDAAGAVHRDGVMRLATAKDEIVPQRDPRVRENEAYLTVLLLSRVITRLGTLARMSIRASSRTCSPPTWRSSRTSTGASTRKGHTAGRRHLPGVQQRVHRRDGR